MTRYMLFGLAIIATTATAIAAAQPYGTNAALVTASVQDNVTVIAKNSPFPVLGPIEVQECAVEDCSDVPN